MKHHTCTCMHAGAQACVCVCKGSLYALPAGVSSCKTCRRAYPAGYRALEAGLDRESRKTACLIDPLRAELMARVQSSRGALTPLVSPSTQRSRLSALIGPSMCLQTPKTQKQYSGQMVDRSGLRTDRTGQTCQTGQDKTYIHADIVRLVRCPASVHLMWDVTLPGG